MSGDLGPLESRTCHMHISKDSNHNDPLSVAPGISYSSPLSVSKGETQQGYLMSPGPPDSLSLCSLSLPGEGFLLSLRSLIHSLTVSHRRRLQSLLLRYPPTHFLSHLYILSLPHLLRKLYLLEIIHVFWPF